MEFQTPPPKEKKPGGLLGQSLITPEGTPDTPAIWGDLVSSSVEVSLPTLSIMSWNVWFDKCQQVARYQEIFRSVFELQPDIVCFQEATTPFMNQLVNSGLLDHYDCSDNGHGETVNPYGVVSLARKHLHARFAFVDFPTRMSRKLLVTHLTLTGGERLAVGNVHLESLDSRSFREAQLRISHNILSTFEHAMLCGDFNFCSYRNYDGSPDLENRNIKSILLGMEDLWPYLYGEEPQCYTFDGRKNRLVTYRDEQMRYDRICFRSSNDRFRPDSMRVLDSPVRFNNQPLAQSQDGYVVLETVMGRYFLYPSDHFGLFGNFVSDPTSSGSFR